MTTSTQLVDTIVGMNLSASMFCLIVGMLAGIIFSKTNDCEEENK